MLSVSATIKVRYQPAQVSGVLSVPSVLPRGFERFLRHTTLLVTCVECVMVPLATPATRDLRDGVSTAEAFHFKDSWHPAHRRT